MVGFQRGRNSSERRFLKSSSSRPEARILAREYARFLLASCDPQRSAGWKYSKLGIYLEQVRITIELSSGEIVTLPMFTSFMRAELGTEKINARISLRPHTGVWR